MTTRRPDGPLYSRPAASAGQEPSGRQRGATVLPPGGTPRRTMSKKKSADEVVGAPSIRTTAPPRVPRNRHQSFAGTV